MNRTPPNLSDAAERTAYRRELRGVVPQLRYAGLGLIMTGLAVAVLLPQLPGLIPLALIASGFGLMVAGIVRRMRYHRARMRGEV